MARTLAELKQQLAAKLHQGCLEGVDIIKEATPIDTQRLFESVDAAQPVINDSAIECKITLGGKTLYGVQREQDIKKSVNYAKYVEARYGFVRQSLAAVSNAIVDNLES